MNAFLASTRCVEEAAVALAGGADWIDLKEPADGALGAVATDEINRVVGWVRETHCNVPVSATIGDCWNDIRTMISRVGELADTAVDYVKIGLFARSPGDELLEAIRRCCDIGPSVILVCFAENPPHDADIDHLAETGIAGMMLDTADKAGGTLTERLGYRELGSFVRAARSRDLLCGLAGSLKLEDIDRLAPLRADYLGFRGLLCDTGTRTASLNPEAVAMVRARLDDVATIAATDAPVQVSQALSS